MATNESTGGIESVLKEQRKFPPPPEFSRRAHVQSLADYEALYRRAAEDPEGFWKECAGELFWFKPFAKVLDWNFPLVKWFVGGELNASYNCIDRHLAGPRRNKAALIWEGEPGDSRVLTYQMLAGEVARCANGLRSLGVKFGDLVTIYMPMVPEAVIAMLACARIGATHSVVFGGFWPRRCATASTMPKPRSASRLTADGAGVKSSSSNATLMRRSSSRPRCINAWWSSDAAIMSRCGPDATSGGTS